MQFTNSTQPSYIPQDICLELLKLLRIRLDYLHDIGQVLTQI